VREREREAVLRNTTPTSEPKNPGDCPKEKIFHSNYQKRLLVLTFP